MIYRILIFISLTVFLQGCTAKSEILSNWENLDSSDRAWYEKHLSKMNESNLALNNAKRSIRFTWLRNFHEPISVRIDCDDICSLTAKRLSGKGGYEPGKIVEEISRTLTKSETEYLDSKFREISFWEGAPDLDHWGIDGARWILEAKDETTYRAWDIWSPQGIIQYERFTDFCKYSLKLSGLEIKPDLIY